MPDRTHGRAGLQCRRFLILLSTLAVVLFSGRVASPETLTASDPGQPAGANIEAGTAGVLVGRVSLSVDTGTVTVTCVRAENTGTGVASDDVLKLHLFEDANENGLIDLGTDTLLGHSKWRPSAARYVFDDLAFEVSAGVPRNLLVGMTASRGAAPGATFSMAMNDSDVQVEDPGLVAAFLLSGNSYSFTEGPASGSSDPDAPVVLILNPAEGVSVSEVFRFQVHLYNPGGLTGITHLDLSTDGGISYPYAFDLENDLNTNYNVGSDAGVFETVPALPPAAYTLKVRAQNATSSSTSLATPVFVNPPARQGDGMLLRRDNSEQLCMDCHAMKHHSSQSVGGAYGSWAVGCRDCHTPHRTTNIFLIREKITVPGFGDAGSGVRQVTFSNTKGYNTSGSAGEKSYVNSDGTGPCEVCHTRTSGPGGVARWRNTGNGDSHYADSDNPARCTVCHPHSQGFKAEPDITSPNCNACHLSASGGGNDLDNYVWGDGTTATIDLDEWLTSGHGSSAGYASGNPAADFRSESDGGCRYCHDEQTGHDEAGMAFFRLKDQGTGPAGSWGLFNGTCLVCHASTGSTGYQPEGYSSPRNASAKVDPEIHDGAKHDAAHDGGENCWDCHDPHGDDSGTGSSADRWFMIQRNPVQDRDDTTAVPSTTAPTVTFQNASTYTDYTSGGLCVNCHTSTDHYAGSIIDDHPNDDYGSTERCTSCHLHDSGFENVDNCPGDPGKMEPGICGCGTPDTDGDGDGYYVCEDCDDTDPDINPDTLWYPDADGDGFGTSTISLQQCAQPAGYVRDNTDYDDGDPFIYPGGPPARIAGSPPTYYWTLQEIYNAARPGDTIEVQAVTFNEDLNIGDGKSVLLKCGHDVTFTSNALKTILNGDMNITDGTLNVEQLIIQ